MKIISIYYLSKLFPTLGKLSITNQINIKKELNQILFCDQTRIHDNSTDDGTEVINGT
jgi:hypothetical protein